MHPAPRFTVVLPVNRAPSLMKLAIETVLAQTLEDFELFVICDGAPAETIECGRAFAKLDKRVGVFEYPKGERFGEAHRDRALGKASGRYVAHISDDDLWLPNHLEEAEQLLLKADFGNILHVQIHPDGGITALASDLSEKSFRDRLINERYNRFGLTYGVYRLDAYRRLAVGWSPAPPSMWTDLHMWRKFLNRSDLVFATRMAITAINFPKDWRIDMPIDDRERENRQWLEKLRDPQLRAEIVQTAWKSLVGQLLQLEQDFNHRKRQFERDLTRQESQFEQRIAQITGSKSWRYTAPLRTLVAAARRRSFY